MNVAANGVIVREIEFDAARRDYTKTHRATANGLLLTSTGRIVLQRRPNDAAGAAGMLGLFGTAQEPGETFQETGLRVLKDSLGINLDQVEAQLLGAIEVVQPVDPTVSGPTLGLSVRYFWPIIGTPVMCREGTIESYRSGMEILALPNLTKCASWALGRAMERGLIPA